MSTPSETAGLFRSFHAATSRAARDVLVSRAPLPRGSSVVFKIEKSATHDQDRLNLSKSHAESIDKVWGMVIGIKDAFYSANTLTPACIQVLLARGWVSSALFSPLLWGLLGMNDLI